MRISMIPSAILFLAWGQCMRAFIPLGGAAAAGRDGLAGRGNPTRGNYESHIENLPARLSVPVGPNLGYTPIDHECACQRRLRQSIYGNIAPPGYCMLFLLNSQGIPALANCVHLEVRPILRQQ